MGFRILATGLYLPERVLTNADLEAMVDTSDEWIFTRTGIRQRRLAARGETSSTMGAEASRQALAQANLQPEDLDLILTATVTPDSVFPSTACYIQHHLGAHRAAAFDLQAACSGFVYSMVVAAQFFHDPRYRNILLVGTERLSSIIDWTDRNTCVLFGDGAGAAILQRTEGRGGLLAHQLGANGSCHEMLKLPNINLTPFPGTETGEEPNRSVMFMAGKEVFKQAVNAMAKSSQQCLEQAGLTAADLTCVISHQANIRIIDALREKLKIPTEKVFVNVDRYGNISAACIPVALHEAHRQFQFKAGDRILLVAFGGGLTWASAILEWA